MSQWKYGYYVRNGKAHIQKGMPCQDSVFQLEDENCIVLALCDGIGSLPQSGRAGQLASMAACHILRRCAELDFYHYAETPDGMMKDLLEKIDGFISRKFGESHSVRSQGDSTLAFIYISKRYRFVYAGCLGDSAVCLIRKSGNICLTENNPNVESTATVNMRNPWKYSKTALFRLDSDDFLGAILTSDGLDGEIYAKNTSQVYQNAAYYFNAAQRNNMQKVIAARVEYLVAQSDSCFDDDISVAVISRAGTEVAFPKDITWMCSCGFRNRLDDTYCQKCGNDFIDVYRHVSFDKYGGKVAYFRYANQHPEYEKKTILTAPRTFSSTENRDYPFRPERVTEANGVPKKSRDADDNDYYNNKKWEKIAVAACLADGEVKQGQDIVKGVNGKPDQNMQWWQKFSLLVAGATTLAVSITVVALHKKGAGSSENVNEEMPNGRTI